ncbi:MAG: WYL domain-containing protein [Terracidiphilus sp.]|jgi:predicted DNA-binding transcriptional regulator YafY
MKSDRLLSVLLLLQAKGRVTERELAERLEVSQRTVHRDMEALSAARIPLSAVRGSRGGWELEKGWRTQVPGLNDGELRALLMAQPRALGHSRLAAAAESALNKLMAALPVPMQAQAAAMRQRLHVDPTGWRGTGDDVSMLAVVQEAVADDRRLAFDYTRADGQTGPRTVDPLGLVAKGLSWYLVARGTSGMRTYRVSRMQSITALATKFERPAQFDLAAYWKNSTAQFSEQHKNFTATLFVTAAAAQRLSEWGVTEEANPSSSPIEPAGIPPREGWKMLTATFVNEAEAQFIVQGLGSSVRVVAPTDFRQKLQVEAAAVVSAA